MRTLQEFFDVAYRGLREQGFQKSTVEIVCAYRGNNGFKCAIGHCIPDENYNPKFEGKSVLYYLVTDALGLDDEHDDHLIGQLRSLQLCHDDSHSPIGMKRRLNEFAYHHDLTIPDL